jgi:hypothetical protein
MLKHLIVAAFLAFALSLFAQTPGSCEDPVTFVKKLGSPQRLERAFSICATSDGNVYLAGRQHNNPILAKITPNGEPIWVRGFPSSSAEPLNLTEIIEDSEGNIVICGTQGLINNRRAVLMRYDPVKDTILWYKHFAHEAIGVMEKNPGDNFILHAHNERVTNGVLTSSIYLIEFNRTTGTLASGGLYTRLEGSPRMRFESMIKHQGNLYGAGGWQPGSQQPLFAKISITNGNPEWAYITDPDTTTNEVAASSHRDIVLDEDQFIITGSGHSDQGVFAYLEKHAADGSLLWMKRYDLPMQPEDVIVLPDAYFIYGKITDNTWGMIKTDKDGNLLQAKTLITAPQPAVPADYSSRQSQVLHVGNHLLMIDSDQTNTDNDIILVKTDLDVNLDDSCSLLQQVPVNTLTLPAKIGQVTLIKPFYSQSGTSDVGVLFQQDALQVRKLCPQCPCIDKPDITCHGEEIFCVPGDGPFVKVKICNLGQVAPVSNFYLNFYDKNPLTDTAKVLHQIYIQFKPAPGDCFDFPLPLDPVLFQYSKIYTLAGVTNDVPTPISLDSFPFPNGYAECDYSNNLDSFEVKLPDPVKPDLGSDRNICEGQTVALDAGSGYVSYKWLNGPSTQTFTAVATGVYQVEVTDACGRTLRDTVAVTIVPPPAPTTVTIQFYPGDTVVIDGTAYTQSGTVVQTLTSAAGCDSVVNNILQLVNTTVGLQCAENLTLMLAPNQTAMAVNYNLPTASTDCPDPDITLTLLQGPPPGALFPAGVTQVCYEAANQCGIRDTCCFTVTVEAPDLPEEDPCDIKTPPGCFRYELLGIQLDSLGQRRYRVRITNTCASPLLYTCIQLPKGVLAVSPKEGATYAGSGGNTYAVHNPNFSPFYSIRYKSIAGSLNNGASDVFEYTLPQQSAPDYIHVFAKLTDGTTSETHLNTFYCPVEPFGGTQNASPAIPRSQQESLVSAPLAVRPNPTSGQLFVDLRQWRGQQVLLRVLNTQGQLVLDRRYSAENEWLALELSEGLSNGMYFLSVQPDGGSRAVVRFVLER